MIELGEILLVAKYAICIYLLLIIICAPAWLARQTKKDNYNMILVRIGSWLFLWSGVGWLWALYWSVKK